MALYEITAPNGSTYQIEGPDNAPEAELIKAAKKYEQEQKRDEFRRRREAIEKERNAVPPAPPETTILGQIGEIPKALGRGAVGLGEAAGVGIAAALPEDMEKSAREGIKDIATGARSFLKPKEGYEDTVVTRLSEGLGSTLPFFALGPLGGAGLVAGAGLGVAAGAGEARQLAEAKGATGDERALATALGIGPGLLDVVAPQIKFAKNIVYTALLRGGMEGATEAAQKVAQNLIAKGVYDPEQPIFAGSGEEGAYGAGVGALASLLVDSVVRRKGGTQTDTQTTPPTTTPTTPIPTSGQQELFPSDVLPPESASNVPTAGTPERPQGELFPAALRGLESAQTEDTQRRRDEERDLADLVRSKDAQLDMFAEPPAAKVEPTQGDLLSFEEKDIADMLKAEEIGKKNEAELNRVQVAALNRDVLELDKLKLKFESDLSELEGRLEAKDIKTIQDKRLELLLPIIEDTENKNIPKEFIKTLKAEGITDTEINEREKNLINRAYDIRNMEMDVAATEADTTSKETKQIESLIPEKKDKVRQPEQLQLPGVPKPKVGKEEDVTEAEKPALVTPRSLDILGVLKAAPIRQRIVDKDLSNPADAEFVRDELISYAENPNTNARAGQRILSFVNSPIFKTQAEMFGPRGGVLAQPKIKEATNVTPTETGTTTTGTSVPSTTLGVGTSTAGTATPKATGVGGTGKPVGKPKVRKAAKPTTLSQEEQDALQSELEEAMGSVPSRVDTVSKGATEGADKGAIKGTIKKPVKPTTEATPAKKVAPAAVPKATETVSKESKPKKPNASYTVYNPETGEEGTLTVFRDNKDNPDEVTGVRIRGAGHDARIGTTFSKQGPISDKKVLENFAHIDVITTEKPTSKESKPSKPKEEKPSKSKEEKPTAEKESKEDRGNMVWQSAGMSEPEVAFHDAVSTEYKSLAKEDVVTPDDTKALGKLARTQPTSLTPIAKAAKIYFSKMKRGVDNLLNMAFDAVYDTAQFRRENESEAEAKFFSGMNGKNAKAAIEWVRGNLSPEANKALDKFMDGYKLQRDVADDDYMHTLFRDVSIDHDETIREYTDAEEWERFLKLPEEAALGRPLHPAIIGMLRNNDLAGALRNISGTGKGRIPSIANKLANILGDVNVEVVDNLKDEAGNAVSGYYDPKTNTVKLDSKSGTRSHTVLHEAVHAATSHILENKSHPVTKQLTQLYNDVKGWLDTAYGATSLDEFVAEAFSNPEFQAKLAAINPKGDKITAWQRFTNTVGNYLRSMVGMKVKPLGSALDVADNLIDSILSPSPETRNAGLLYMNSAMGDSSKIFARIGERYMNTPKWGQELADKVHEFLTGTVSDNVKDLVRAALPLHALVDVAKPYIAKAPLVDRLVAERSGAESLRNQSIEPILARTENWAKSNPSKINALNEVVYESTLIGVDPTKSITEYENKTDKDGNKLDDAWRNMQPMLRQIGPDGVAIYKMMRDSYKKLYDEILRVVNTRIDDTVDDKERANIIKKEIYSRLTAKGGLDPYFPLTREGQYWLSYKYKGELYVGAFETKRERDRAIKEYEANGATNIEKFANLSKVNYRNAPPTSFVNGVLQTLEVNKVNPEVTEEVMRLFLSTLPETSFAQSFRARKGTLGFERDAVKALRQKTLSISRQLANMEYGAKLNKLRSEMEEDFRAAGSKEEAKPYLEALNEHISFAVSPQIPKWSKLARSFGFNMTLGFNISSAVVNVAQVPLIVAPYLGGKYGQKATAKALANATRLYMQSGFQRDIETFVKTDTGETKVTVRAAPSIDNYNIDDKNASQEIKRLKTLVDVAGRLGQLNRSQLYDTLDVTDPKSNMLDRINAASGFVFHHGERMNRQVTMVAAYNLELDRMQKEGRTINEAAMTEAAENAIYMTEMTNGGTSAAAAPRLAQSGIGAVVFMFKRYGASMYYLLFKTAREALQNTDGKTRAAAMRQIAGIYGSAALFAGARGLPMFGMVALIYNLFKGDDEDDFQTATRKFLGEGLYSGAINATTGLDIASRIGLSDLIFRDQKFAESTSVIASLAETMGGPVFGVASRVERGLRLISEGHIERGIEAILPSAAANLLRAYRYSTEGTTTLRGDPITGDVSSWNVFAQIFGFAPAEYTRQLEINAIVKGIDKRVNEEKTNLLRQFYVANRMGDHDSAQEALQELIKLQKKHPGLGITAQTIINSMKQHNRTTATMYHGITLSKGMRAELLADAREFDDGYDAYRDHDYGYGYDEDEDER